MRRLLATLALCVACVGGGVAVAEDSVEADTELREALQLRDIAVTLSQEGRAYGAAIEEEVLGGQGGFYWEQHVGSIYDPDRIENALGAALEDGLDSASRLDILTFFETELGQRILRLENEARVVIADPDLEAAAIESFAAVSETDRARDIRRFVKVNALVEYNVRGTQISNFEFQRGILKASGDQVDEVSLARIIDAQEDEVRQSVSEWIHAYLMLAYAPLTGDELASYITFSESPSGKALNTALFAGFEDLYRDISADLGRAAGRALNASDL
jgi:hypothetical protein